VAIVGQVELEAPQEAGYRDVAQQVVISAPPGGHLLASDDTAVAGDEQVGLAI